MKNHEKSIIIYIILLFDDYRIPSSDEGLYNPTIIKQQGSFFFTLLSWRFGCFFGEPPGIIPSGND
jgi:hypothetical protein